MPGQDLGWLWLPRAVGTARPHSCGTAQTPNPISLLVKGGHMGLCLTAAAGGVSPGPSTAPMAELLSDTAQKQYCGSHQCSSGTRSFPVPSYPLYPSAQWYTPTFLVLVTMG